MAIIWPVTGVARVQETGLSQVAPSTTRLRIAALARRESGSFLAKAKRKPPARKFLPIWSSRTAACRLIKRSIVDPHAAIAILATSLLKTVVTAAPSKEISLDLHSIRREQAATTETAFSVSEFITGTTISRSVLTRVS